ncbi:MAG: LLM class F420-dependent oxidoreductase, partial [Actinomycetota bacterium]|nr:LLM class F420-dependent oxidoreductase [Actinomycetota bacterium]
AFYGSTPNYAFQFDDLGFEGTTGRIRAKFKAGELDTIGDVITDEMLDHFAVVAPWDELADALISRYAGRAARVVMYLGENRMRTDPQHLARWGEVARAVQEAR